MTAVPRPSLQKLLPDELMHMVQTDLLHPGLGQVSQRARERGPQMRAPAMATSSLPPTQSSQSRPTQLGAARKGRACCLLGREQSIVPAVLPENKWRQLSLGVMKPPRSALSGMLPVVTTGRERHPEGGAGEHPQCPGYASRSKKDPI